MSVFNESVGVSVNAIKEDNKPEGNGRSDQKSLKCYRCGQSGHFARDKHIVRQDLKPVQSVI